MKETAKMMRWTVLFVSLTIELLLFWFAGTAPAGAGFWAAAKTKAASPWSWTAMGLASLTLYWVWLEWALHPFRGGRVKRLARDSGYGEVVYRIGVHVLVFFRSLWTGLLLDGDVREIEDPVRISKIKKMPPDEKGRTFTRPSFAWRIFWFANWVAVATTVFFLGLFAWVADAFPARLTSWSAAAQAAIDSRLTGGIAFSRPVPDWILTVPPRWLQQLHAAVNHEPAFAFGVLVGTWFALFAAERVFRKIHSVWFRILTRIMHLGVWLTYVVAVFSVFSLVGSRWLTPIYTFLPNNGPVAMGYFPLTIEAMFLIPHVMLWKSWQYALVRDPQSLDGALLTVGGVFNREHKESNFGRIVDTELHQWWWERMLGIGSLKLIETGGGAEGELVKYINGPNRLYMALKRCVNEYRRHGSHGTE